MPQRNSTIHIFYGSRLVREKGVDILIDAIWVTLTKKDLPYSVVWTIASDGPFQEKIIALTKLYPGKVIYLGRLSPVEMAEQFRKADIFFMPSRFLETFGLTALESLASHTLVVGFHKGGLIPFIPKTLALDPDSPVSSLLTILSNFQSWSKSVDVTAYWKIEWRKKLVEIFRDTSRVLILHDYFDLIGWAEYYVMDIERDLSESGFLVYRYGHTWKTTVAKRRWLFLNSIFAFGRGLALRKILETTKPQAIWMHSILRYIWYWWVREVSRYVRKNPETRVFLSHHDIGLIAPFPQDVTDEIQIPTDSSLRNFFFGLSLSKKIPAFLKWCYISLLRKAFPKDMTHIIFSPFLEKHIQSHFEGAQVIIFPHSYDETIFHR